ncbi:MAG: hypothetical protein HQK51_10215 [Oligoflexia bacterium]|nr:hypothetical protein [Oligoflexia bacterium]
MDITNRGKVGHPPRILEYRRQVKISAAILKYVSYFFLLIFLVIIILACILIVIAKTKNIILIIILASCFGIVGLFLYLEYFFLLKPMAISKIQAFSEKIVIRQGKKETIIPFDDIVEIKSSVNKHVGGWFTLILKNKKKYRFTITLERIDYLLDAIIKYRTDLMNNDKYLELRKQLILSDHGLARISDLFNKKYRINVIIL